MTPTRNPVYAIIAVRTAQASALAMLLHWVLHWPLIGPHALGLFFTPLLCLYFVFVFVAPWNWGLPIRTRMPTHEKVVALTFDDGPSAETTPTVLNVLARHGVSATFFVLGEAVARQPAVLRRIVAEGHTVALHGDHHIPYVLLSWKRVGEEIKRTREKIHRICPEIGAMTWLRPPHGFKTLTLPWAVRREGCRLITWTVNATDYGAVDHADIGKRVLGGVRPGAIILLHDGEGNLATAGALPAIIDGLRARGYGFAILD